MTVASQDHQLFQGDVDQGWVDATIRAGRVACDLETTGLDWANDTIATCQLAVGSAVAIVQFRDGEVPSLLRGLIADPRVTKIFHHAPFDLRFMANAWSVAPASVACTKIASKIIEPGRPHAEYSLKPVLRRYLNVDIDKTLQVSDWSRGVLSEAQLEYAASDVRYLNQLYDYLREQGRISGVDELVSASFDYLPTRVALDLSGAEDVFSY